MSFVDKPGENIHFTITKDHNTSWYIEKTVIPDHKDKHLGIQGMTMPTNASETLNEDLTNIQQWADQYIRLVKFTPSKTTLMTCTWMYE